MIPDVIQDHPVKWMLLLLGAGGLVWFTWWAGNILLPFLIAFILAYILDPAVDWTEAHLGLGRMTSIIILTVVITLGLAILGYFLTQEAIVFGHQVQEVLQDPPDVRRWVEQYVPEFVKSYFAGPEGGETTPEIYEQIKSFTWRNLTKLAANMTEGTTLITMFMSRTIGVINFLVNFAVVVFSTIYLLRDFDDLVRRIRREIPPGLRERSDRIVREIHVLFREFFRGHLIICLVVGVLYGAGYLLVDLEGGFLIGFLGGLMNVIPYVGSSVAFLLALVMGLAQFGLTPWLLSVAGVFVLVQSLEGNILRPAILGSAVGMNPVIVIFSLMVFGKLMGFIGLLLAVPIAAVFKVILKHILEIYHESTFYRTVGKG